MSCFQDGCETRLQAETYNKKGKGIEIQSTLMHVALTQFTIQIDTNVVVQMYVYNPLPTKCKFRARHVPLTKFKMVVYRIASRLLAMLSLS